MVFVVKNEDDRICAASAALSPPDATPDPRAIARLVNKLSDDGDCGNWSVEAWLDDKQRGLLYVDGLLTETDVSKWLARITPP
jgi:hypothetical protein